MNTNRNSAAIMREMNRDLERLKQDEEPEGAVELVRRVEAETETDVEVETDVAEAGSWEWSESSVWGFSTW
ncbi:hypothetical protein [Natronococcus roseus]|uniref:hypothetical protein n=1 Tax=Natronococcus roseus TaxID=1052014 RepID=UPI00374DE214